MRENQSIQALVALALIVLGLEIMLGWVLQITPIVQFRPGFAGMVFNSALCFVLAGIALILPVFKLPQCERKQTAIGWTVIAIASISLLESVFDTSPLIDFPFLHSWLQDFNPRPGRLPAVTSVGFMLAGFVIVLMPRVRSRATGAVILVSTFSILILGIGGVAGRVLDLHLIYPEIRVVRMAAQAAVAMIALAIGLWDSWRRDDWYCTQRFFKDDEKTGYMSATIMSATALTAGIIGFGIQQDVLQRTLSSNLESRLKNHISLFHAEVDQSIRHADDVTRHADLIQLVRAANMPGATVRNDDARDRISRNLLAEGFNGIAVYDAGNREILRAGRISRRRPIEKELSSAPPVTLRWDGTLLLGSRSAILDNGRTIGVLELEQRLPLNAEQFAKIEGLGATGEMGVCFGERDDIRCFPQGRNPTIHWFPRVGAFGKLTAMGHALEGRTGIFIGPDYRRHDVIAAYAPLTDTGLGIVLKQDAAELYHSIRQQLNWYFPLLMILVAGGAIMLRSEVKPLVSKLLASEQTAKERELHVRTVVDSVGEGIITISKNGTIESFNRAASRIFGYSPEEIIGCNITTLIPPELRPLHNEGMRRYVQTGETKVIGKRSLELPGLHKSGTTFPLELAINATRINGNHILVGVVQDITERKKAELALQESEARSREIAETLGEGVFVTGRQGVIVFSNPAAQRLLGWSKEELLGQRAHLLFHHTRADGSAYPEEVCDITRVVSSGQSFRGHDEMFWRKDGSMLPVSVSSTPIIRNGKVTGAVVAFHDIIERKKSEERMHHLAHFDILTDLPNRALLRDRLQRALAAADRNKHRVAVMFIDLDKFKPVNDTLGHDVGDLLLKQVAHRLRNSLRESDTVARVGGDEFIVLLPIVECEGDAVGVANKIRDTLNQPFMLDAHTVHISASIGVAVYPEHGEDLEQLMKNADDAMYRAKEGGGASVLAFSQMENLPLQQAEP
ncbi:diguanylate cyclase [Noviherbaspirillum sp.]|jgi:diguanylate cyclase (GGDEF)-like protein/PAS domain S-box-containing protein|uniref:diguanylate cyclase domain-containing protein n=1 Tax=Noviherbaspirillum sp. TaxID=1926288 RepID=UPI0025EC3615|nr:diguanylate cyclase [Noviherbaspirillum sp.]